MCIINVTWQPRRWTGMLMHEQWQLHYTSQWGWETTPREHVYCVAVAFKMTEWVEQRICIRFYIKPEHSSLETIQMIQKATGMGKWWLAASSWQRTHSCIASRTEFFGKTSNHPGDSAPLQPKIGTLRLLAFPKIKITLQREEISDHQWNSGQYNGAADGNWENCVRAQGAALKETETSLSYVQCFLYLVSSSINVSIFHTAWMATFWTDLIIYVYTYIWNHYFLYLKLLQYFM